jgi:hypothetical protein
LVDRRIGEGCTNATQLQSEILALAITASPATVKRLAAVGEVRSRVTAAGPAARVPTPWRLSFEWGPPA